MVGFGISHVENMSIYHQKDRYTVRCFNVEISFFWQKTLRTMRITANHFTADMATPVKVKSRQSQGHKLSIVFTLWAL